MRVSPEHSDRRALEDQLRHVFTEVVTIPDEEWRFFWPHVRERLLARSAHVYRARRPAPDVHYILQGLVRIYHNGDGVEYVRGFDYEGRFIAV